MDVPPREDGAFVFGPFRLNPVRRTLTNNGNQVTLTARLFDTLLYLVQNPDRLVERGELEQSVWRGRVVEDGNLQKAVSALRKALQEQDPGNAYIVTLQGRGLRFAVPVAFELEPPPAIEPQAGAGETAPAAAVLPVSTFSRRRKLLFAGLAAGSLSVLALAFSLRPGQPPAQTRNGGKLVLAPLENLTADADMGLALTHAVEVDLAQSPNVTLLSPAQVQATLKLMTLPPDKQLSPAIALEVCARNEGRAVIGGSIAHVGDHLLVTLTAVACGDGAIIAADKSEADRPEALLPELDHMVGEFRRRLGESDASLRQHDVPLVAERTASFDALRALSKAIAAFEHGNRAEAVPLLLHATDLDPQFAAAWSRLGTAYLGLNDLPHAVEASRKAYALRDTLSEPERYYTTTSYEWVVTKDFQAALGDLRNWSEAYPLNPLPLNQISNIEMFMGNFQGALEDGQRALDLGLRTATGFMSVAHPQMALGRFDDAVRTAHAAEKAGVLGEEMRGILIQIAYARNDRAQIEAEIAAARGTSAEIASLKFQALTAYAEGRVRAGEMIFERRSAMAKQFGVNDEALAARAAYLFNYGLIDEARAKLDPLGIKSDPRDYLLVTAEIGDAARAAATVDADLAAGPDDTMLHVFYAPIDRAALALRAGHAAEAVADLRPTLLYQWRDFTAPYLLGNAYLLVPDGPAAVRQFQAMLDRRGVFPASPFYTLAYLGLARACHLTGDLACSRREYTAFLQIMTAADQDLPVLQRARSEYAALSVSH